MRLRVADRAIAADDVGPGHRRPPFVRHHVNTLGRYSFHLPDLPGGLRPLRDKDADDEE